MAQVRSYRCGFCSERFQSRALLHVHKTRVHEAIWGGSDLQESPFPPDVNPFEGFPNEDELEEIYTNNRKYILKPHQLQDSNNLVFNFPVAARVEQNDIVRYMNTIFEHEASKNSYKFNVGAGVILQHSETMELRYFRPEINAFLLDSPLTVTNRQTLQESTDTLIEANLDEMIRGFRPNTKYVVIMITQLNFFTWPLNYPLGYETILPDYIIKNRSIITMGKEYYPEYRNCCMFVALAQFLDASVRPYRHKRTINKMLIQWVKYVKDNKISEVTMSEKASEFEGVEWRHLNHFEDCFKVNIIVMNYSVESIVTTCYTGQDKYERTMYLNKYETHVSLITSIDNYTKRYQCRHCKRLQSKFHDMERHEKTCKKMTKFRFPSGAYHYFKTVHKELQTVGISVPEKDQFYHWFLVFDFESLLIQTNKTSTTGRTEYISEHIPVSVSLCSNVTGFKEPHFILSEDPKHLVQQMIGYCYKVRRKMIEMSSEKWGGYLERVKDKLMHRKKELSEKFSSLSLPPEKGELGEEQEVIEKYKTDMEEYLGKKREFVTSDAMLNLLLRLYKRLYLYINQFPIISFNGQRYDLKLIMGNLVRELLTRSTSKEQLERNIDDILANETIDLTVEQIKEGEGIMNNDVIPPEIQSVKVRKDSIHHKQNKFKTGADQKQIDLLNFESIDVAYMSIEELARDMGLEGVGEMKVVKRNGAYAALSNNHFTFLDVCNYLPAGSNYKLFLLAYGAEGAKSYFPYEYCTSFKRLFDTLPPYDDNGWRTCLRNNSHLLEEEHESWVHHGKVGQEPMTGKEIYKHLQQQMERENLHTLADLLRVYNNNDTKPFVDALENMLQEYIAQKLDIFKISISIPGVARIKLMEHAQRAGVLFPLFHKDDEDAFFLMKEQIVGGPSIIFNRHVKVGKTKVHKSGDLVALSCYGFDANSLYNFAFQAPMPTQMYVRRFAPNFEPEYKLQYYAMYIWMEDVKDRFSLKELWHRHNTGHDIRLGPYLLDGMGITHKQKLVALEYNSCYHHGHSCKQPRTTFLNNAYDKWLTKANYVKAAGFDLKVEWECSFKHEMHSVRRDLLDKMNDMKPNFLRNYPRSVTKDCILAAVMKEELYGFLLVDIHCPEDLKSQLEDFPPIFANHTVKLDDIGAVMQKHVKEKNIKFKKRRLLLSGFEAEEILLSSRLLAFYMKMGLKVINVHQVIEYVARTPFVSFVDEVTRFRMETMRDPARAMVGNIYKLIGVR